MNKLNFRLWDNGDKKFFTPIYNACNGELLDITITLHGELLKRTLSDAVEHESLFKGRYEINQFIGLIDINGVKLYENDIIKYETGDKSGKCFISYVTSNLISGIQINNFEFYSYLCKNSISLGGIGFEIIGNIYENSELLNK